MQWQSHSLVPTHPCMHKNLLPHTRARTHKDSIFFLIESVGQGVRKHALYFLWPSYWGIGHAHVIDAIETVEQSEDEDVLAEEAEVQSRLNAPMAPHSAIEIRGRMMGVCPQAGLPTDPNPVLYFFINRFVKI
jgi:hypothetical protein